MTHARLTVRLLRTAGVVLFALAYWSAPVHAQDLGPVEYFTSSDGVRLRALPFGTDASYQVVIEKVLKELALNRRGPNVNWQDVLLSRDVETAAILGRMRTTDAPVGVTDYASFRKLLLARINSRHIAARIPEIQDRDIVLQLDLTRPDISEALATLTSRASQRKLARDAVHEASLPLTPIAVIGGLKYLNDMIDNALDKVDAIVASQLASMRGYIAASIADLNAVFKNRMEDSWSQLNQREQEALNAAFQLQERTQRALDDLQTKGYEIAADSLCQATIASAEFKPIKIFSKQPPPDIVCMVPYSQVHDQGPNHEQLVAFRGINLKTEQGYPNATISIPSQQKVFPVPVAGGSRLLQVPLAGGINGGPGDTSSRGSLIAQAEFSWTKPKPNVSRWMFRISPFIVYQVSVTFSPQVKIPVYSIKSQNCTGEAGNRDDYHYTCTVTCDDCNAVVDCWVSGEYNRVGRSGYEGGPVRSAGACTQQYHAAGDDKLFGGGGSIGFTLSIRQARDQWVAAPEFNVLRTVDETRKNPTFKYDPTVLPSDHKDVNYFQSWKVEIRTNQDEYFALTNAQPADSRIGGASVDVNGVLTLTLR